MSGNLLVYCGMEPFGNEQYMLPMVPVLEISFIYPWLDHCNCYHIHIFMTLTFFCMIKINWRQRQISLMKNGWRNSQWRERGNPTQVELVASVDYSVYFKIIILYIFFFKMIGVISKNFKTWSIVFLSYYHLIIYFMSN